MLKQMGHYYFLLFLLSGFIQTQAASCLGDVYDYEQDLCAELGPGGSKGSSLSYSGSDEIVEEGEEYLTGGRVNKVHWGYHHNPLYPPPYLSRLCVSEVVWCYMPLPLPIGRPCSCTNYVTGETLPGVVYP